MGDVNAVYTLDCAHRLQLLAARALNERSPLDSGTPLHGHKDDRGMYTLTISSFSAFRNFRNVHVASLPMEVRRADALNDFLQMPTNAGKSGSALTEMLW